MTENYASVSEEVIVFFSEIAMSSIFLHCAEKMTCVNMQHVSLNSSMTFNFSSFGILISGKVKVKYIFFCGYKSATVIVI